MDQKGELSLKEHELNMALGRLEKMIQKVADDDEAARNRKPSIVPPVETRCACLIRGGGTPY
eukprot:5067545-Prymnesium_polylepis.1